MKSFTIAEIEKKYGISRYTINALMKEGFVAPARGKRHEYRFSFRDLVLLKMAGDLLATGISAAKIMRLVRQLRKKLAENIPLEEMRISAAGSELVVRQEGILVNVAGQQVIDFNQIAQDHAVTNGNIGLLAPNRHRIDGIVSREWHKWYRQATSLEATDPLQSIEYYRRVVEAKPDYIDAWLNLGCLLIEGAQYLEAYAVHQEALIRCPASPILCFNFGIVCEELEYLDEALRYYKQAIVLDPAFADAHYNIAQLHEILGHHTSAVRHYSAYRRLNRQT
jgi:tetratricopeptide (TPR) repeat protein